MRHHLAILYRNHLDAILAGEKTIECRLSKLGYIPRSSLDVGDLIWLKESSGPIRAVASAGTVKRFDGLTPARVDWLQSQFNDGIQAPASFWQQRRRSRFATLIWLENLCIFKPFWVVKRDRRAWVVLSGPPIPGRPIIGLSDKLA